MNVQLGIIYCGICRTQLATHICAIRGTDELICPFCAGEKARAGNGKEIVPVYPSTGWGGMGFSDPLTPFDAIALLVRNGATILEHEG